MPAFSFKKKCAWCEQYEAAQRGEVSDVQPVMAAPWQRSVAYNAPVTTALLVLNVVVFLLMAASGSSISDPSGQDLIRWGSNFSPFTLGGQYWRLVTHMFVHIGYFHLLMNIWFLYALGSACERLLGSVSYAVMYLIAGVAGGVASLAWHPITNSAGASGALFGILGAMIAAYKFGEFSMPRSYIQASLRSMLFCAGINLLWGMTGGIDNAAHIGGLVAGFLFGLLVVKAAPDENDFGRRFLVMLVVASAVGGGFWLVMSGKAGVQDPQVRAGQLLQQRKTDEAIALLEKTLKKNPNDTVSRVWLASLYDKKGRKADAFQQNEWVLTHAATNDYSRSEAASMMASGFITDHRFAEGEKYFSEMAGKSAADPVPHQALGELAEAQGHQDAAIAEFQKVLALQPKQIEAYGGLGRSYAKLQRFDDSIAAYRKAIELSDDEDDDYGFREQLKAVEKAKQDATKGK